MDLDGTLAEDTGWHGPGHVGEPVWPMLDRVRGWLAAGRAVKVVTARVAPGTGLDGIRSRRAIGAWLQRHLGRRLPVVCYKDRWMEELWDDRAVPVETNTGRPLDLTLADRPSAGY